MCKCDYTKCRKDCPCPCHEHVEAAMDRYYELGQIEGLGQAQAFLLDQAGEAFKQGSNEKAELLREISLTLKKRAQDRRKLYDAKHKTQTAKA